MQCRALLFFRQVGEEAVAAALRSLWWVCLSPARSPTCLPACLYSDYYTSYFISQLSHQRWHTLFLSVIKKIISHFSIAMQYLNIWVYNIYICTGDVRLRPGSSYSCSLSIRQVKQGWRAVPPRHLRQACQGHSVLETAVRPWSSSGEPYVCMHVSMQYFMQSISLTCMSASTPALVQTRCKTQLHTHTCMCTHTRATAWKRAARFLALTFPPRPSRPLGCRLTWSRDSAGNVCMYASTYICMYPLSWSTWPEWYLLIWVFWVMMCAHSLSPAFQQSIKTDCSCYVHA